MTQIPECFRQGGVLATSAQGLQLLETTGDLHAAGAIAGMQVGYPTDLSSGT